MKNIYVYCEGQTEESFVNHVLYDYFFHMGIFIRPIICTTSRKHSKKFKGGVSDYNKIKNELVKICKGHSNEFVTTMFDYYAMPSNTPGIENQNPDIYVRIQEIEDEINEDIGMRNCSFHLMLHEFESMLFSKPSSFSLIVNEGVVADIQQIRESFPSPEHINNSPDTAPSKRLELLIPNYAKVRNGTMLTMDMGIEVIMDQCPHFREWIDSLKVI